MDLRDKIQELVDKMSESTTDEGRKAVDGYFEELNATLLRKRKKKEEKSCVNS